MSTIPQDAPLKQCSKCKEFKPATNEYFPVRTQGVLYGRCKPCYNAGNRAFYTKQHPPKESLPPGYKQCYQCNQIKLATPEFFYVRKSGRNSGKLMSPCILCATIKRHSHTEERRLYSHQHYLQHKEEKRLYWEMYYEANREAYRQSRKRFRQSHPELFRQRYQATRTDYITYNRNRKARKKAAPGKHTAKQIREQYDRQRGKCYYCQHKVTWGKHHADHVIPLSRGGSNDISNIVIACPTCNLCKQDKLPHEFFEGGRLL